MKWSDMASTLGPCMPQKNNTQHLLDIANNFLRFLGIVEATNDRNMFVHSIHTYRMCIYKH